MCLLLPVTSATLRSSTSLLFVSVTLRSPVAATQRLPVLDLTQRPPSAAPLLLSLCLLLPVLRESSVCQGVQRRLFVRLVRAWGLELAVALLRIALVNALGLRRACGVRLLWMVISTRETVGKDFSFPAQCGARGVLGLIVDDPRWEPRPQEEAWTLTSARRRWLLG